VPLPPPLALPEMRNPTIPRLDVTSPHQCRWTLPSRRARPLVQALGPLARIRS
jgi:hypothetical protein